MIFGLFTGKYNHDCLIMFAGRFVINENVVSFSWLFSEIHECPGLRNETYSGKDFGWYQSSPMHMARNEQTFQ